MPDRMGVVRGKLAAAFQGIIPLLWAVAKLKLCQRLICSKFGRERALCQFAGRCVTLEIEPAATEREAARLHPASHARLHV